MRQSDNIIIMNSQCFAILLAAGKSERFNSGDNVLKQFQKLDDKDSLLSICLKTFLKCQKFSGIAIALPDLNDLKLIDELIDVASNEGFKNLFIYKGGNSRQESVRLGLELLKEKASEDDIVLIHDVARALVTTKLIDRIIESTELSGSGVAAIKSVDTLVKKEGSYKLLDRENVYQIQTPQGFKFEDIYLAHEKNIEKQFTDDSSLLESTGKDVILVEGDKLNFKVTTTDDLELMKKLYALRGKDDGRE